MSATRDLLIEIGTEELPPKALRKLELAFAEALRAGLGGAELSFGKLEHFATPRRLAARATGLSERQADRELERRGPPLRVAYDASGNPTKAAEKFATGCGVTIDDLQTIETDKGEYLLFRGIARGETTAALLPAIVQTALDALPIPKRMRWGALEAEFVRPVHWVLLRFGNELIDAEILGVSAGGVSYGHRFHAPEAIAIEDPQQYEAQLAGAKVLVDFERRRDAIEQGAQSVAQAAGGRAHITPELLDEVTALVEWPVPLVVPFEPRFLDLPREVLIATLQEHQRYFPAVDDKGELLPWFVTVSNIESRDPDKVREGNERVVRPRLADAAFFWDTDSKRRLDQRREALGNIVFQQELGTIADKTERVARLASTIAREIGADPALTDRAARIAKCDLLTEMVGEFPELQGTMGRYYAALEGEPDEVAVALEEQYLPRFAGDKVAATPTGLALAIADKLDTIVGIFGIGKKPTGTRDPFGLRRAALGVLRSILERGLDLDLTALIDAAADAEPVRAIRSNVGVEVYDYMLERLRAHFVDDADAGYSSEMFASVRAKRPVRPLDFEARLVAVREFSALDAAAALAAANKRIANILRTAKDSVPAAVDTALLAEPAEQHLHNEVEKLAKITAPLFAAREYRQALETLAGLRGPVDSFFDDVMVMADDTALRRNRLALLSQVRELFLTCADLSLLS